MTGARATASQRVRADSTRMTAAATTPARPRPDSTTWMPVSTRAAKRQVSSADAAQQTRTRLREATPPIRRDSHRRPGSTWDRAKTMVTPAREGEGEPAEGDHRRLAVQTEATSDCLENHEQEVRVPLDPLPRIEGKPLTARPVLRIPERDVGVVHDPSDRSSARSHPTVIVTNAVTTMRIAERGVWGCECPDAECGNDVMVGSLVSVSFVRGCSSKPVTSSCASFDPGSYHHRGVPSRLQALARP